MSREQSLTKQGFDAIDYAAVWPSSAQIAPFPVWELEQASEIQDFSPAPAAPDVPAAVGGLIAASYASLIAMLALATAGSAESIFAIVVAALFVLVFFTVPRILFVVERDNNVRASLDDFLYNGIDTFTGHNSGKAALVQMLVVPVMLTFGVAAIGVTIALVG